VNDTLVRHHPTVPVLIRGQEISVDEEIVPLVQWFNGLKGVQTLFCCQGDDGDEENVESVAWWYAGGRPYVMFTAEDVGRVEWILRLLDEFRQEKGWVHEAMVDNLGGRGLRFTVRWVDKATMLEFTDFVLRKADW
jgi:hypothetical protein